MEEWIEAKYPPSIKVLVILNIETTLEDWRSLSSKEGYKRSGRDERDLRRFIPFFLSLYFQLPWAVQSVGLTFDEKIQNPVQNPVPSYIDRIHHRVFFFYFFSFELRTHSSSSSSIRPSNKIQKKGNGNEGNGN